MTVVRTSNAPAPKGPYSQGRIGGGLLFVAGQAPFDAKGNMVGTNIAEQTRATLENVKAIVEAAGASLNDQELAWTLVCDAPKVIHELETRVGCFFDRAPDGRIQQKAFAGQQFDRTVHRGDLTGIEIMGRLRDQMFRLGPRELEDVRALDLVFDAAGELAGVTVLDAMTGALAPHGAPPGVGDLVVA